MNAQLSNPTTARTLFTWLCAVSPCATLFTVATVALHDRLGHHFWPGRVLDRFPALDFAADRASCAIAVFFSFFAAIHLIVTLIHHRQLGVRLRVWLAQAILYAVGCVAFIVTVAKWFLD